MKFTPLTILGAAAAARNTFGSIQRFILEI
jgi:hypothetical protein